MRDLPGKFIFECLLLTALLDSEGLEPADAVTWDIGQLTKIVILNNFWKGVLLGSLFTRLRRIINTSKANTKRIKCQEPVQFS